MKLEVCECNICPCMSMICGDIQNAVAVCTVVSEDEDDYDLLSKSVNSPDYLGHDSRISF